MSIDEKSPLDILDEILHQVADFYHLEFEDLHEEACINISWGNSVESLIEFYRGSLPF